MRFYDQYKESPPPPDDAHPFYIDMADDILDSLLTGATSITIVDPNTRWDAYSYTDFKSDPFRPMETISLQVSRAISRDHNGRFWIWLVASDNKGRYVTGPAEERTVRDWRFGPQEG